ncbi:MAG: sodium:glutamate symporter [Spirochaetales bacterium]|uniref:Sodium:glutamate symporter n=1 Tax=Candidatus Thalassospirochaeta sargassi TaxID=3119039 RepID=A0AAJ1IEI9_9SPIO|nr:sodium:glutamate symporter [Spirochaetales bacterium]
MSYQWSLFIHLGIISCTLLLATWVRTKVNFFQRFLIPNSLLAGFILLPFYNFIFPRFGLSSVNLGEMAYHLLSLSFVALSLKALPRKKPGKGRIFGTTLSVLFQFGVQGFLGLILTFIFIKTIRPDLFHSFGYLLPLGFAQGPGQAYSIGESWKSFGVEGAGSIGLTFAALGFILCSFGGIFIINLGMKKGWIPEEQIAFLKNKDTRPGIHPKGTKLKAGSFLTTETEAIDTLTLNVALVSIGYFAAFLTLKVLDFALSFLGPTGERLADTFWGLSFIFAALAGLLIRQILKATDNQHIVDNMTMNRLTGFFVDLMVAAAIAAISLVVVRNYWGPIIITAVLGATIVAFTTLWYSSRIFTDHRFLRSLLVFGVSTGTLSTGLALLRVVDPDFETPVATDYTYASAITFVFALPYILSMNLTLHTYTTGDWKWFWLCVLINVAYLIFTGIMFFRYAGKRAFKHKTKIWYPEEVLSK